MPLPKAAHKAIHRRVARGALQCKEGRRGSGARGAGGQRPIRVRGAVPSRLPAIVDLWHEYLHLYRLRGEGGVAEGWKEKAALTGEGGARP